MVEIIEIPAIECGIEARCNPLVREVRERHLGWLDEFGACESEKARFVFEVMDIANLACLMYPDGRVEDVALVADWSAWLLIRDDRWDATDDLFEWERLADNDRRYLALMRGGGVAQGTQADQPRADGLYVALSDLCSRTRGRAAENGIGNPVNGSFVGMMGDFFRGSVRQAFLQRRAEIPSLAEYTQLRRVTGGLDILTHVIAATDGVPLSGGVLSGPLEERLTLAADNICCWHNDLVSLNKELAGGEINNLSIVLSEDPSVPCRDVREGLAMAVEMLYGEQYEFDGVRDKLLSRGGPKAAVTEWYVGMLEERIAGIISWQERCARYSGGV